MTDSASEELWGGRFQSSLDPAVRRFTGSLGFDRRLVRHDLVGSMAHARSAWEAGVLEDDDAAAILSGLSEILADLEAGRLDVTGEDEDVHSWLERTLAERIGPTAGRLHTGRSRNDQTSAALRLWTRDALEERAAETARLVEAFCDRAADHVESWMPGYTHLQRAQPVSLAHHLLAHARALLQDGRRLRDVHRSAGVSPLGAGAVAGTSHPIDPRRTARLLGFEETFGNSLHAVADRDYVAEACFAGCLLLGHLSRWAEELVLWSSREFGFVELDDAVAQGSSLMPQKKNPEAAELLRARGSRAAGRLAGLLSTLQRLPLAYHSDLQEDKEPLFDVLDSARDGLGVAGVLLHGCRFRTDRLASALEEGFPEATRLADLLVERGVPFREAHRRVGRAVLAAEERGCSLPELPDGVLSELLPELGEANLEELRPDRLVRANDGPGGPAPGRVREQLEASRERADALRAWAEGREPPPVLRAHREGSLLAPELSP